MLITDYCLLIAVIAVSSFTSSNFPHMPNTSSHSLYACIFQMHVWFQVLLNTSPVPLQFPNVFNTSSYGPLSSHFLAQSCPHLPPYLHSCCFPCLKFTIPGLCNISKSCVVLKSALLTTCMAYSGLCSFSVL